MTQKSVENSRDLIRLPLTFADRADIVKNETARKLLYIMEKKRSNLAVAVDLTTQADVLAILRQVGPYVCLVKTHVDIITDFDASFIEKMMALATTFEFLLFEDRKFADIGHTVQLQYEKGIFRMVDWADMINAHTLPGPGIIEGLKLIGQPKGRGLLLLAEMSSRDHLFSKEYLQATLAMAKKHDDFVMGFISQRKLYELGNDFADHFLYLTPGVHLESLEDTLQQQYNTPWHVINELESDIIIVGRGIYKSKNPAEMAKKYRDAAWMAYEDRLLHFRRRRSSQFTV